MLLRGPRRRSHQSRTSGNDFWNRYVFSCWRNRVNEVYNQKCSNFLLCTTQVCYLMTTFWCPSDILITSGLFTARWSTWPGNHLVTYVAELVGSCIPIHARRCLPDPKCLYPSGVSLCLSVDHFCQLHPVDDMVLFHGMVCDGWLVSYTALPCSGGSGLCTCCERVHFFLVFLDPQTKLPACLSNVWAGALIKMSDEHRTLSVGNILQLCRVRSFYIIN